MGKKNMLIAVIVITFFVFLPASRPAAENTPEQKISELETKIGALQEQVNKLTAEKDELFKKNNKLMEDKIADAEEIKKFSAQIAEEKKNIESLNAELKKTEETVKNLEAQSTEKGTALNTQLEETKKSLETKTSEAATLNTNLEQERQKVAELSAKLKEKEESLSSLESQLAGTKETLQQKETEVSRYRGKEEEIQKTLRETVDEMNLQQELSSEINKQLESNKALYKEYTSQVNALKNPEAKSEVMIKDGEKYANYVTQLDDLDLNKINSLTISELKYYVANFPALAKADECILRIAALRTQEGDELLALVTYLKMLALYPQSELVPKAQAGMKGLEKEVSKDIYEKIMKLPPAEAKSRTERFYKYLNDLHTLNYSKLNPFCLEQQEEFLRLYKDSTEAFAVMTMRAETYLRLEKYYEAVATYLKLTQIYPLYPEVSKLADAYYSAGDILAGKEVKDYAKAIKKKKKGINLLPKYKQASAYLLTIARTYEDKLKTSEKAISTYRNLVNTYPESIEAPTALAELGHLYKKLKQNPEAINTHEELVKKYPKDSTAPRALIWISAIYEETGDYPKAIASYLRLAAEYPTYEKVPEQLFRAGDLCEKQTKDNTKALEIYQQITKQYPGDKFAESANKRITALTKPK